MPLKQPKGSWLSLRLAIQDTLGYRRMHVTGEAQIQDWRVSICFEIPLPFAVYIQIMYSTKRLTHDAAATLLPTVPQSPSLSHPHYHPAS